MQQEKPRRLEEDTVAYLASLSGAIDSAKASLDGDAADGLLVDNVLEELKTRLASAACDRNTHALIEDLVLLAGPQQLVVVLQRLTPYAEFLASHRYSSHILQTVISKLVSLIRSQQLEEGATGFILAFARPLVQAVRRLASDMSGSHVMRALLSLLAGIPVVQERKGKNSKHKHSVSAATSLDLLLDPSTLRIRSTEFVPVAGAFTAELQSVVDVLLQSTQDELLGVCVNSSGCVVLALLVRILGSTGSKSLDALLTEVLFGGVHDAVYGLAGERGGSYFLEAAVESCELALLERIAASLAGRVQEYASDGSANFVLQSVFKRLARETDRTPRGPLVEASTTLLKETFAYGDSNDVGTERLSELLGSRGGVVVWALACARNVASFHTEICEALLAVWTSQSTGLTETLAKLLSDGVHESGVDDKKEGRANLLAARIIRELLSSPAAEQVIEGLSFLPPEALRSIATNGQLSRNVLDPVLERQRRASPAGTTRLVHALITHSQELASHFSGQHVLKKLYDYVGVAEKEAIASTLSRAKDALGRTKEGRSSLQHVLADVYAVDPKAWRAQVLKQAFASAMLEELETELTQTPGAAGDINIDTGADRKRKRKRRRSDAPGKSSSAVEPEKL